MKVLVTGHRGKVGVGIAEHLRGCGHAVGGFDLAEGVDLLDLSAVQEAAVGCAAIVHLGGVAHDSAGTPEQIVAVNVLGTWHVLLAAEAAGVTSVIHFSSVQALGIAEGERLPDYFPIDDEHPRRAIRPYGLSKRLSEDLCEAFSARTGIATLSLRPVSVWQPETYARVASQRRADPESESQPFWEYGAFVDVRDVAAAVSRAVEVRLSGHHRALLCAADIAGSAPSLELARRLCPGIPIKSPERYRTDPTRALVDCSAAETLLGWRPRHRWSDQERAI
jgi:UDP-glucose 4-epimerase